MADRKLIDGFRLVLGEREFIVPPLTLRSLRLLAPKLRGIASLGQGVPEVDQLGFITDVVLEALRRNYPDVTADQVEEMIDTHNMTPVLASILSASGLEPAKPGELVSPSGT